MQSPGMHRATGVVLTATLSLLLLAALTTLRLTAAGLPASRQPAPDPAAPPPTTHEISSTHQVRLPYIVGPSAARVLIAAAHVDSVVSYEPDEAFLLWNVGGTAQSLAGWSFQANSRSVTFPLTATLVLAPHARLWCAAQAGAFRTSFGEEIGCEWAEDTDADVLDLDGTLTLPNSGGALTLRDAEDHPVDTLLYGAVTRAVDGWTGAPAQLYTDGAISAAGQVWQRKRDPTTGLPLDTDQATDWAGDRADLRWGRQVRRPGWLGWDAATLAEPPSALVDATTTVAVGPEGLYTALAGALNGVTSSLDMSVYTLEHPSLTEVLRQALARGVQVRILLEGSPPGGITDEQRWCVAQLAAAGADVRYMAANDDAPRGYSTRYSYSHAKYLVLDGRVALVGTDNFNLDSVPMPADVPSDSPVGGRRGAYLITDAAPVVAALQQIFNHDWQPDRFRDLTPYTPDHPRYGDPPDDFVLPEPPVYTVDAAPFADAIAASGPTRVTVISAPENALRPDRGLFALLEQAGPGDVIRLEQLYEHKHWGESTGNPVADANPRLEAVIAAARRGATVRILLDSFFDDGEDLRSNRATVEYVRAVAAAEGLDLEARLANPTGGGIHMKLVLVQVGGETWSAVGSLNGSEISHKVNREVVLLTDAAAVYTRLSDVFTWDWAQGE